ncbi:MAG: hypothetical protein ABIF77_06880 [bacterium]
MSRPDRTTPRILLARVLPGGGGLLLLLVSAAIAWAGGMQTEPEPVPARIEPDSPQLLWPDDPQPGALEDDLSRYMLYHDLTCEEVSYNCFDLLPRFFYEDKPDSVFVLLDYWETVCGPAEPIRRSRLLARIWLDEFGEDLYDFDIVDDLLWYHEKYDDTVEDPSRSAWAGPGYMYSDADFAPDFDYFDLFTADLADQLLAAVEPGSLAELFCRFYAGNLESLFPEIQQERFAHTKLRAAYEADVARYLKMIHYDLTFYGGLWQPQGGLARLGSHPLLGVRATARRNRLLARASLEFRFGDAPQPYRVFFDDWFWDTRDYVGTYIGLEPGVALLRGRHHGLDLHLGIGYEEIVTLPANEFDLEESHAIDSFNLSASLTYRFYFGPYQSRFFGLETRFEDTNHGTGGGSDLSGNAWSFRLGYGFYLGNARERHLFLLHHGRWRD